MNLFRIASLRIYYKDRKCTYNENWGASVQPLLPSKSSKYYIFCEGVCSLKYPAGNAPEPYYHLWPAPLYTIFPHFLIKRHDLRKNVIEPKMCVLIFSSIFIWHISHFKKNWARYRKYTVYWSSCKVPIVLVRFKWNLNFLVRFPNNTQISNFMKLYPVEAELLRANGQTHGWTDRLDEASNRFSEFCERA
jgi:hypothetical protein